MLTPESLAFGYGALVASLAVGLVWLLAERAHRRDSMRRLIRRRLRS